ncbi:hypothetical protein F4803DRAFT_575025 [Xylaria telfairii]|nr:hypothetical protein F4803DRAFT_575025 [Xylaria telfairii]
MDNTINPPSTPDYYRDLGVSQAATPATIRQAFKKLALATHPDKIHNRSAGGSNDAAGFRKVHEAYEYLSDPVKRATYDERYIFVQAAWERYRVQLEEKSRREHERLAKEKVEEEQRAAEAELLRKLEEQRKAAEEKARREKLKEERARQAELRSREVARKAWEQRQREAEERIRLQKEAAAEARSREVAEKMRAEQEKSALERLRLARIQEKQDASRRIWANFDHTRGNSSHGGARILQIAQTQCLIFAAGKIANASRAIGTVNDTKPSS